MSAQPSESNAYLGEVLQKQQRVEEDLKRKVRGVPAQAAPMRRERAAGRAAEEAAAPANGSAIDYRITGWGRWKTVVVPPNVYVVHTRRGRNKPMHVGLGVSFRYNPYVDAFLVIPAAMQTIVINARCICVERQGILVQAYVQWIIDDIEKAYRRLDFSDTEDPMRIVNVQLREQAEAAIKDKVATMHIDEILADKQPIIEELTLRLRAVAEGSREAESGLGLKIVTVQIKEAVVSSTRLWENLQKPFRAERDRLARIAELETERQVAARELEIRQGRETAEIANAREIANQQAAVEREAFDRNHAEKARRTQLEQEAERAAKGERTTTAKAGQEAALDLALKEFEVNARKMAAEVTNLQDQKKLDAALADRDQALALAEATVAELRSKAQDVVARREIDQQKARQSVENDLSAARLQAQLIGSLPEIAGKLPAPAELRTVQISGDGAASGVSALAGLVAGLMSIVEQARAAAPAAKRKTEAG